MSQDDMWDEQPVRPKDTHTDNEELRSIFARHGVYDGKTSLYFQREVDDFVRDVAQYIHTNHTPQAAVQGDLLGQGGLLDQAITICKKYHDAEPHSYLEAAEIVSLCQKYFSSPTTPTKSSGELEEILKAYSLAVQALIAGHTPFDDGVEASRYRCEAVDAINALHTTHNTRSSGQLEDLIEHLADIEHQRWADWQEWCHKVLRENNPSPEQGDILERWDRQIETPYADLSEREKQSDRDQVMRYWPVIEDYIATQTTKLQAEAVLNEYKNHMPCKRVKYRGDRECYVIEEADLDKRIAQLEREHKIGEDGE